ncbi:anti-sigma factor [Ferrimonas balearica]|nr:anti-sigma factor [Ferrimonas balearica]
MSDTPPPPSDDTPPDSDLLRAAEYVLGLLEPAEAEAFEARLATDPALRALTAAWADDLVAITDAIPEAQVPDHVWQALQARLWPAAQAEGGAIPRSWRGFIASLGLGELVVGTVAAALLAFVAWEFGWMQPDPDLAAPEYVAEIGEATGPVRFAAGYDTDSETLVLERLAGAAAAGRSLELWLIAGDAAPVSVAVWPEGADRQEVVLPSGLAARVPEAVLAVSDEPAGGSPTGLPTGAVLATGAVRAVAG